MVMMNSKQHVKEWIERNKLGLFIHWGLYSLGEWHEQELWRREMSRKDYEKQMNIFNPTEFNPDEWIDVAESAGMTSICITTKHHDGFCLWDTAYTDYNIMNTPYKRDIIKELSQACHRRGMEFGIYYSLPDWHHKNYPNKGRHHELFMPRKSDEPDEEKYIAFVKNQIEELCSNYGDLNQFFWDVNVGEFYYPEINERIRELQPGIIINDRGPGQGDYVTPERSVPKGRSFKEPTIAIQSMGRESWSFRRDEDYYSHRHLMESIDKMLAMGGAYQLNIGPKADGTLAKEDKEAAMRIGDWFKRVEESFQGTEPASHLIKENDTAMIKYDPVLVTKKDPYIYIHAYKELQATGIMLYPLQKKPKSAVLLNTMEKVETRVDVTPWRYQQRPALRIANLPVNSIHEPLVIRLEFEQDS